MESILPSSRKPDISFHPSGKIDISARIARLLDISPGDIIDILLDADGELYLYVKLRAGTYTGHHQGRVNATARSGKGTTRVWSRAIARAILAKAAVSGPLRCPCGSPTIRDNKTLITIIYRHSL